MTRAKLAGIWIVVLIGGLAVTLTNASREHRLLSSEGVPAAESAWSSVGQELLIGVLIAAVFLVPMTLFGVPGKLNQRRVSRLYKADSVDLVVGVWRANPNPEVRNGAPDFPGMAAVATTLLANSAGLQLVRGFARSVEPWRIAWEVVDEIDVEYRTGSNRSAFGPILCIRTRVSADPIRLYVVDQRFPWFAAASAVQMRVVVDEITRIRRLQKS